MSREVRRVPLDWKHPVQEDPYWQDRRDRRAMTGQPASRLRAENERFVPLYDSDYAARLAEWEEEGRELAQRTGSHWTFSVEWFLTGTSDCNCRRYENRLDIIHYEREDGSVTHPAYRWDESGNRELPFVVRDEDHLYEILLAEHENEKPDPADYMPTFDVPEAELGWCLYETVSEGTPVTPVFATAEELIEHLATVGQDWDQVPMRRSAAETLVTQGFTIGSMLVAGGQVLQTDKDADRIADHIANL